MAIITISRELGSLGTKIAENLAAELKYSLIDRKIIEEKLHAFGFTDKKIDKFDEKKPSFWSAFSREKDRYLNMLKLSFFETSINRKCIFLGRGSQQLFKDVKGVLKILFTAPKEERIKRISKDYKCDEHHAEKILNHSDQERAGYHKFFFNIDWKSNSLYDLIINTKNISEIEAVKMIKSIVKIFEDQNKDVESSIKDLIISQKIINTVLYDENINVNLFEAFSKDGNVTVYGNVSSLQEIERITAVAKKVEGVKKVKNEIIYINDYPVYYSPY